jgi:hypothetical protein
LANLGAKLGKLSALFCEYRRSLVSEYRVEATKAKNRLKPGLQLKDPNGANREA